MRIPEKKTEPDRKRDFDPRHHAMLSHGFFKADAFLLERFANKIPQKEILLFGTCFQGVRLMETNRQGARCISASVNGMPRITKSRFDSNTAFAGVGLDATIIDSDLKAAFKNNIRRNQWRKRAKEGQARREIADPGKDRTDDRPWPTGWLTPASPRGIYSGRSTRGARSPNRA